MRLVATLKRPLFNGWPLFWLITSSVSLVMATAWANTDTTAPGGVSSLIQLSVRLAVPFLFLVFVASALQILRPGGFSLWLLRNRKYLGLVFASAMAWQALFILWLVTVHRDYYVAEVYLLGDALSGVIGYGFLTAMTITSFMPVRKRMRPRHWKWLHKAGIYVLWAYAVSTYWWSHAYYADPGPLDYLFYAAAALAWMVRILAWRKKRLQKGVRTVPGGEVPAAFMAFGLLLASLGVIALFTGPYWQAPAGEVLYGTPGSAWATLSAWAETRVPQWAFQPFLPLLLIIPGIALTSRVVPRKKHQRYRRSMMKKLHTHLALMFLLLPLAVPADTAESADTVWTNGRIYTANPAQPWAGSMAVRDGKIIAIGAADAMDPLIDETTRQQDLGGHLVLPGLIDAHAHPGYIAKFSKLLDLPAAQDRASLLAGVARLVADHPELDIVQGIGWDNSVFGPDGPHRSDLDAIEPDRPVLLWDITMHTLWVNSAALEYAGVDESVVDPLPRVSYYRRDENGALTGYITESAAIAFANRIGGMNEAATEVLADYLHYLASVGVTTVFDAGNFGADEAVYAAVSQLDQAGKLPVRYFGAYTLFLRRDLPEAIANLKALGERFNSDRVQINTLKIYLDGVIESRTAHLLEDYSDTPGNRGGSLLSREELEGLILELDREGLQLHVHALGDRAVRTALDAVENSRHRLGRPLRTRVALTHLQLVDPADWPRFAELDVIAQFTPAWHGHDEAVYASALGNRVRHSYPVRPILDSGAVVNFSSDVYFPSEWHDGSASPFTGMQVGHRRQFREDAPDGPRSGPPEEQLPLEVLVQGYTRSGAWQLGQEATLGSLEVGKHADFIVLGQDLFTMDPTTISSLVPEAVVVNGQTLSKID